MRKQRLERLAGRRGGDATEPVGDARSGFGGGRQAGVRTIRLASARSPGSGFGRLRAAGRLILPPSALRAAAR